MTTKLNKTANAFVTAANRKRTGVGASRLGRGRGNRIFQGRGLSYEGTEQTRQTDDWSVGYTDPAALTAVHLAILQARSRSLARTSPAFISAITAIVDMVIEPVEGVRITSKAYKTSHDEPNEDFVKQARNLWEDQVTAFDVDGRESAASVFRLAVQEWVEVGECFLFETIDTHPDRPVPVTWKIIPAERVDHTFSQARSTRDNKVQNRITNGIEFDSNDRRVAYHVTKVDDNGMMTLERERIDARKIHHLFLRKRAGQERGLPWLYGATLLCHDLEDLVGDELTSAHVASMLTAFIKRENPGTPFESDDEKDEDDRRVLRFKAGAILDIGTQEDIVINKPDRPGGQFLPFASFILRCIAKTIGISFERLSGDYSQVNFASGRLAHLAERETVRRIQGELIQLVVRPIWRTFIRYAIAFGKFTGTSLIEFLATPAKFVKANFMAKGFEYHDPLKEVTAALIAIAGGLSTEERECALRNMDWEENLQQRAKEVKARREAGVPLFTIGGAQVVTGQGDGMPGGSTEPADPRPGDKQSNRFSGLNLSDLTRLLELFEERREPATAKGTSNGH